MGCGASKSLSGGSASSPGANFLDSVFVQLDTDNSGSIDKKELRRALASVGLNKEKAVEFMSLLDPTNGEKVSKSQWTSNMPSELHQAIKSKLNGKGKIEGFRPMVNYDKVFAQIDRDKNGKLDKEEVRKILILVECPDRTEEVFNKWDADGDGIISKEEFVNGMDKELLQRFAKFLDEDGLIQGRWMDTVFSQLDSDNSGFMDMKELKRALAALQIPKEKAVGMMAMLDPSGKGKISKENWKTNMGAELRDAVVGKLNERGKIDGFRPMVNYDRVFNQIDLDKNGQLDIEEVRKILSIVDCAERTEEVFAKWDSDGDGMISKDEFVAGMDKPMLQLFSKYLDEDGKLVAKK